MKLHISETSIENNSIHNTNAIDHIDIIYVVWSLLCKVYSKLKNSYKGDIYECDDDDYQIVKDLRDSLNICIVCGSKAANKTASFLRRQIVVEKLSECIDELFDEWHSSNKSLPSPSVEYCNYVLQYARRYR